MKKPRRPCTTTTAGVVGGECDEGNEDEAEDDEEKDDEDEGDEATLGVGRLARLLGGGASCAKGA